MKIGFHILLISCFWLLSLYTQAQQVIPSLVLHESMADSIHLEPYLGFYVDTNKQLGFEDIRKIDFTPLAELHIKDGYEQAKFNNWALVTIENPTEDTLYRALQHHLWLYIDMYQIIDEGKPEYSLIGRHLKEHPHAKCYSYASKSSFLFTFPPKSKSKIYYLPSNAKVSKINTILFKPDAQLKLYHWDLVKIYAWNAAFLGILLFVILSALGSYLRTRQSEYLWYCGYILVQILFFIKVVDGYDLFFDWMPDWYSHELLYTPLSWGWSIFYILFVKAFFATKKNYPIINKYLNIQFVIIALSIFLIEIFCVYDTSLYERVYDIIAWFMRFTSVVAIFFCIKKFPKWDPFHNITAGTFCYAIGSIMINIYPNRSELYDETLVWNQLGILGELFFFNMALTNKMKIAITEKQAALIENEHIQKERIHDIDNTRSQIAQDIHDEVGSELAKLMLTAQLVTHDPSTPVTDIYSQAEHIRHKIKQLVYSTHPDSDQFESFQAFVEKLVTDFWKDTNMVVECSLPPPKLSFLVPHDIKKNMLMILVELQSNIVKHAQAQNIQVKLSLDEDGQYLLSVHDDGIGFNVEHPFNGSLGIKGVRLRAEVIQAKVVIQSTVGLGTKVFVAGKLIPTFSNASNQ
jgi:signal transduction histidine kinase